jgi:hypothetical protein
MEGAEGDVPGLGSMVPVKPRYHGCIVSGICLMKREKQVHASEGVGLDGV